MQNFTPYYSNYQFNPMLPAQQRLAQMEAQYPQYAQPVQGQGARAQLVLNKEEAIAQQVPTDGSITVFINKADGELYTKGLDNMGLLAFKTYKQVQEPAKIKEKPELPDNSQELEQIKDDIKNLKNELKELKNVKQSDTDFSINRTTKKQS